MARVARDSNDTLLCRIGGFTRLQEDLLTECFAATLAKRQEGGERILASYRHELTTTAQSSRLHCNFDAAFFQGSNSAR